MIELELMGFRDRLQVKRERGQQLIFDPIRRKWLVLQPEELVRQLLVQYLLDLGYNKNHIAIEKSLRVNDFEKRFDVLIYDKNTLPFMLIECKAPHVDITDRAFGQITQYNLPLRVNYLLVTNGIKTYCCKMNYEEQAYTFLSKIPTF